jgi:hypothetical protein
VTVGTGFQALPSARWRAERRAAALLPWYYYPSPLAWTSLLQGYDPVNRNNSYETFVLSVPPGANTYHSTPPDVETLARMFGPVSNR